MTRLGLRAQTSTLSRVVRTTVVPATCAADTEGV